MVTSDGDALCDMSSVGKLSSYFTKRQAAPSSENAEQGGDQPPSTVSSELTAVSRQTVFSIKKNGDSLLAGPHLLLRTNCAAAEDKAAVAGMSLPPLPIINPASHARNEAGFF